METPKTPNPKLPDDLIVEIFARLPVKSLLTLKCVCRSWLSLISSNQFVETHLTRSKKDSNFTHNRIMLNCRSHLKQCSASSLLREQLIDAFDWDYFANPSRDSVRMMGYCDGLICLIVDIKYLILWNPSTRTYKKLPNFGAKVKFGNDIAYGIGFDNSSNDYKVVGIFCGDSNLSVVMVKIYSVKTGQWKRIENFKGRRLMDDDPAVFAHGKLHWIANPDSKSASGWDIVFLDLETEQYGLLQTPSNVESVYHSRLVVSEGSLYALCSHLTCSDIWFMNQEGEGKVSWTKVVKIPHINDILKYTVKRPLCVLKNGEDAVKKIACPSPSPVESIVAAEQLPLEQSITVPAKDPLTGSPQEVPMVAPAVKSSGPLVSAADPLLPMAIATDDAGKRQSMPDQTPLVNLLLPVKQSMPDPATRLLAPTAEHPIPADALFVTPQLLYSAVCLEIFFLPAGNSIQMAMEQLVGPFLRPSQDAARGMTRNYTISSNGTRGFIWDRGKHQQQRSLRTEGDVRRQEPSITAIPVTSTRLIF